MIDVSTRDSRRRFYLSSQWQRIRKEVLERDHYECQWCASEGRLTTQADSVLEVDHIKELEYYPEHALDKDNLRTLCKECHNKRHERFQFKGKAKKERKFREDEWWGYPP